jgi:hypothetical protein
MVRYSGAGASAAPHLRQCSTTRAQPQQRTFLPALVASATSFWMAFRFLPLTASTGGTLFSSLLSLSQQEQPLAEQSMVAAGWVGVCVLGGGGSRRRSSPWWLQGGGGSVAGRIRWQVMNCRH